MPNSDPCQIITPLVLVGLKLGVGEGLGLGVGLGLGNHIVISTRGVIIKIIQTGFASFRDVIIGRRSFVRFGQQSVSHQKTDYPHTDKQHWDETTRKVQCRCMK